MFLLVFFVFIPQKGIHGCADQIIFSFDGICLQRSSLGPMVGLPIQKRGRIGGRSGDLLSVRPSEKVPVIYIYINI